MCQIDNRKFGAFLSELRREKKMTQKELADRLYVSDKTVSKWERGIGMPQVSLLLPLADVLEVTVTELLKGERMEKQQLPIEEVDQLLACSVHLGTEERRTQKNRRKKWILIYFFSVFLTALEIAGGLWMGVPALEVMTGNLTTELLMLTFGFWSCIAAKEVLPRYYDENKISFFTDGFMSVSAPGLYFHNGNWPHILKGVRLYTIIIMILNPIFCFALRYLFGSRIWQVMQYVLIFPAVFGLFLPVYIAGKKYKSVSSGKDCLKQ